MGASQSCIKASNAVVITAHQGKESFEIAKKEPVQQGSVSGCVVYQSNSDYTSKLKEKEENVDLKISVEHSSVNIDEDDFNKMDLIVGGRARAQTLPSNLGRVDRDLYLPTCDAVYMVSPTPFLPEVFPICDDDTDGTKNPVVIRYSLADGMQRHFYIGWDDPMYFVGWEVFVEGEGVGHIASCLGPYFSGVRFEVQLQDGRRLEVPFSQQMMMPGSSDRDSVPVVYRSVRQEHRSKVTASPTTPIAKQVSTRGRGLRTDGLSLNDSPRRAILRKQGTRGNHFVHSETVGTCEGEEFFAREHHQSIDIEELNITFLQRLY